MKAIVIPEKRAEIILKTYALLPEKARRQYLAREASAIGYGGITAISKLTGVSRNTIKAGLEELKVGDEYQSGNSRKPGGGRKQLGTMFETYWNSAKSSGLYDDIDTKTIILPHKHARKVDITKEADPPPQSHSSCRNYENTYTNNPSSQDEDGDAEDIETLAKWLYFIIEEDVVKVYGDPAGPLKYCNLTSSELQSRLYERTGFSASANAIGLYVRKHLHYSLQKGIKYDQVGKKHPQRNEQFLHIEEVSRDYAESNDPIFSIDSMAQVKLGPFCPKGRILSPTGCPRHYLDHDFPLPFSAIYPEGSNLIPDHFMNKLAVVTPFGLLCLNDRFAYVSVGVSHNTSEFAGHSFRKAWPYFHDRFSSAKRILILCDGGGSNRSRGLLWKWEVHKMAKFTGLPICICHYPPGTSKWNPIEHLLWSMISINWSGRQMKNLETVIGFISGTSTSTGLKVKCEADVEEYYTVSEKNKANISVLTEKEFTEVVNIDYPVQNGALTTWNYIIYPT